jgi:hypothetical protein
VTAPIACGHGWDHPGDTDHLGNHSGTNESYGDTAQEEGDLHSVTSPTMVGTDSLVAPGKWYMKTWGGQGDII